MIEGTMMALTVAHLLIVVIHKFRQHGPWFHKLFYLFVFKIVLFLAVLAGVFYVATNRIPEMQAHFRARRRQADAVADTAADVVADAAADVVADAAADVVEDAGIN